MGFLIGFPLFIVAPCVIAGWVGTRVRTPVVALVVTWLLTPFASYVITVLGAPILRAITPVGNDGTGTIILPFVGIVTGLIAGFVAAGIVRRWSSQEIAKPINNESTPHE